MLKVVNFLLLIQIIMCDVTIPTKFDFDVVTDILEQKE